MGEIKRKGLRKRINRSLRRIFGKIPTSWRFAVYRRMIDCDPCPTDRLCLKVADNRDELRDCFRILHDSYVASGFMKPDPSGMRVTLYHALPTTTTLCAKYDGRVVGTISMVREGVFGFPMQSVFNLEGVRNKGGNIAEISALAVVPEFRKTGGAILFPLMKFMHQYCTSFFDTRHLVIAVNPEKIELYEALLFFLRLQEKVVDKYDFANGAPAVGATLDLSEAEGVFFREYRTRPQRKNLHDYFFRRDLKNIQQPERRYFTTNDPVMTPDLLDYFFNQVTNTFEKLDDRKKALLWSIYSQPEYRRVLPMLSGDCDLGKTLRRYPRYSMRCPASLTICYGEGDKAAFNLGLEVIEVSAQGFQAECGGEVPIGVDGSAVIQLNHVDKAALSVRAVRKKEYNGQYYYGFEVRGHDFLWRNFVSNLEMGQTSKDLVA